MGSKTPFAAATTFAPTKTASKAATVPVTAAAEPTQEEIAAKAYELFLQDGSTDGRDLEHWLRAEEELKRRKTI